MSDDPLPMILTARDDQPMPWGHITLEIGAFLSAGLMVVSFVVARFLGPHDETQQRELMMMFGFGVVLLVVSLVRMALAV